MSRRRIARGEGVAEFLRFDADGGEHGRLSRIWRLVAARVVDGCRVRDFGWWLDRFGGCPGPRYYQCPTFHPPVPCDRGACARRASVSSCRDRRACSFGSIGTDEVEVTRSRMSASPLKADNLHTISASPLCAKGDMSKCSECLCG